MFELTYILENIALASGIIFFRLISPASYRLIVLLMLLTVLNEGMSHYGFYKNMGISKIVFYNIFFLLEYIIVAIIYLPEVYSKKFYLTFFFIGLLLCILSLHSEGIALLSPNFISIVCIGLVLFPLFYLTELSRRNEIVQFKFHSLFFFSIGIIVAQLFLLFYINAKRVESFRNDNSALFLFRMLNTIGNIIYYLCICYSFLCKYIYQKRAGI